MKNKSIVYYIKLGCIIIITCITSCDMAYPLLVDGNPEKQLSCNSGGYKYQQCIKTSNNSSGTPIRERVDRIMLHCNWGHIGHNGYYLEGLFDEYHKQNGLGGDTEGYYQYDLKMIDNIYP